MTANKIKYGLKNVYFAPITNASTPTFGTPIAWPGAVSLNKEPKGEHVDFYADNGVYYSSDKNNGYDGEFECAEIPQAFKTGHLGFALDSDGCIVERDDDTSVPFALLFEFDGDQQATKHAFFNCLASRFAVAGKTKTSAAEPETTTLKFVASPLNNVVHRESTPTTDAAVLAAWYTAVQFPDPIPSV